jgi:ABC-type transport system involved in multi-copper enzyme maturation permease subunit
VIDVSTILLGPLAGPECSRASRRGWVIWVRILPALAAGVVTFGVLWFWWMAQQIDPNYQPFDALRGGLTFVEGMLLAFAMLLSPAILAGSLAGEKERGSIGLLLTTRVNSAEIVLGRLAGGLSQIAMIELAALPSLLFFAALIGDDLASTLTLLLLPMGVAFGGAGIALAASAFSRRGRDALLFVYLIDVLFLLSPQLSVIGWTEARLISPFVPVEALCWKTVLWPALATSAIWVIMGGIGLALASWRLRPACLAEGNVEKSRKKKARRIGWVPPLDERPMLWKELYIERVGTLGRAGRWIGGLLVLWMGMGSVGLAAYAAWGYLYEHDTSAVDWVIGQTSTMYGNSAIFIGFLIQWAIGLRSAVTISSERERGTWDALLTSPLEGGEIIVGKLWGSLFALKWLIASAVLAWTITKAVGGMEWPEYLEQLLNLATIGPFMAAIGVRTSLKSATATKSMGVTMGLWFGAWITALFAALIVCLVVVMLSIFVWMVEVYIGSSTFNTPPRFPMSFRLGMDLVFYGEFIAATLFLIAETRLRFDRVAGRMTEGAAALAIDRLIHGTPMAPVLLDGQSKATIPKMDKVAG